MNIDIATPILRSAGESHGTDKDEFSAGPVLVDARYYSSEWQHMNTCSGITGLVHQGRKCWNEV